MNALLTLGAEKLISDVITVKADERKVFEKNRRLNAKMLSYLSGSFDIALEEYEDDNYMSDKALLMNDRN